MPRAQLSVSLPEDVWIHEVSTAHAEAGFEVVTALAGEDAGIALVRVTADDLVSILGTIDAQSDVVSLDLLWTQGGTGLVQVEATSPSLLLPLWQAGIPIEMPFSIDDGTATWELTTSSDRLSELGEYLDEAAVEYDLEFVAEIGSPAANRLLTERQREVLTVAIEEGYYAVPREASLTQVAETLGVSKATCSDVLHRAESGIVNWFAEEHLAQS
ncbi:hypothetical protein SAMN05444422_11516 [Halobiforma haloterrestris]|uniref:HTH bat-type domain-containing protein n=1 Tax=Natronobacterium haloterrestre TaxID=148448 RepID=A0A1I1L8G8_NATHA|nr:helix-turn-helix domain-containing protein [Halobiforma haloterrestris]SFC69299.1 hypothetical protein SAMN05444422_11516 [Halobiforma haloterrestris]